MSDVIEPAVVEVASTKDVAENILAWAKKNKLLSKAAAEEAIEQEEIDAALVPQQLFSSFGVVDVLRKRAINLIAYNESGRKVLIFTNGKLNKTDMKIVPFASKDGIQIEYIVGGIAQVKGSPSHSDNVTPYSIHANKFYACGSSIFPVNCCGAGTLGALAKTADGTFFGLTNNHVTGACNHAAPGLPILAPGPLDANEDSMDPFTIGRHERLLPINDGIPENIDVSLNCDVAIFKIADSARVSSMQGNSYDTPALIVEPEPGMRVEKFGRTTGATAGTIIGKTIAPIPVAYAIKEYGITKSVFFADVLIVQGDGGTAFSKPGDSGSLVVGYNASNERCAVGLVFAGQEQRGLSFILSLPKIMHNLGLSLVNGHNI